MTEVYLNAYALTLVLEIIVLFFFYLSLKLTLIVNSGYNMMINNRMGDIV